MTEQRAQYITGDDGLTWHPIQVRLGDLDGWDGNPKTLTKTAAARLLKSTQRLGQLQTIAVSPAKPDGRRDIYDGHQRDAVWSKGYHPDIVVWALESSRPLTDKERRDVVMLTMTARGSFDWDALSGWADLGEYFEAVDLGEWKRDVAALGNFLGSEEEQAQEQPAEESRLTLAERFGVPPFSVLDARQGYWQKRKSAWISLGIQSELGRGDCITWTGDADRKSVV